MGTREVGRRSTRSGSLRGRLPPTTSSTTGMARLDASCSLNPTRYRRLTLVPVPVKNSIWPTVTEFEHTTRRQVKLAPHPSRSGAVMIFVLGIWAFVRALLVSSAAVSLENVALRHQLAILQRSVRRPRFRRRD